MEHQRLGHQQTMTPAQLSHAVTLALFLLHVACCFCHLHVPMCPPILSHNQSSLLHTTRPRNQTTETRGEMGNRNSSASSSSGGGGSGAGGSGNSGAGGGSSFSSYPAEHYRHRQASLRGGSLQGGGGGRLSASEVSSWTLNAWGIDFNAIQLTCPSPSDPSHTTTGPQWAGVTVTPD